MVHKTIDYPGVPVDHSTIKETHGILKNVRIPIRPHFGVMGVAPKEADYVDSIPPSYFGGNMDNWRVGKGATMYYPVAVPGGLFLDRRLARLARRFRIVRYCHRVLVDGDIPAHFAQENRLSGSLAELNYPLLETQDEWVLHGFSFANYLEELGSEAQSDIYKKSSIDLALKDAFRKMRAFLMQTKGLTEDEAISLISIAVDFGVTQVVDGNWGIHAIIKKNLFAGVWCEASTVTRTRRRQDERRGPPPREMRRGDGGNGGGRRSRPRDCSVASRGHPPRAATPPRPRHCACRPVRS